jgi:hypothetical protein
MKGNVEDRYMKDHPVEALAELLGMKSACLISEIMEGRLIIDEILDHLLKVWDSSFLIPAVQVDEDSAFSGLNRFEYFIRDSLTKDLQAFW